MEATIITSDSDVIVTTHPDVALFARNCFLKEVTTEEQTEIITSVQVGCFVNQDRFSATVKFGNKPKHAIHVKGKITYQNDFVGLVFDSVNFGHKTNFSGSVLNRLSDILTEYVNYYHKPEVYEYFSIATVV